VARAGGLAGRRPWWRPPTAALWPAALVAAVVVILIFAALSVGAVRRSSDAWDRLLSSQVQDLVEAERLAAVSELGARLTRDAILTGDPRALRALGRNRAEVADLLGRGRARARDPDEAALVAELEADHARIRDLGDALLEARLRGAPLEALVSVLEAEVTPLRIKIDDTLARNSRRHEQDLRRGRQQIAQGERRAVAQLGVAAALGAALAILLGVLLRRLLWDLRASESRFRATFEQAAVGIAHVSPDGRWLRLNGRYRRLLGRTEEELAGLTVAEVTHPDDRAADAARTERLLAGDIPGFSLEERVLLRDGRTRWVHVTCAAVRSERDRTLYLVRAAEDIAARKRVERELREAVQTRDEFLQVASHELRTPLASLRLRVESLLLAVRRGPVDRVKLAGKAETALRQTARLAKLVDGLLEVSRLSAGAVALLPEEVDLAAVARSAAARQNDEAARAGSAISVQAPDHAPARADRFRVEQAIGHLLSNALRYGAGKPIEIRVEPDGDVVRIAVADHGVGLSPEDMERIFGRFERASSWRHYGGLGLGLFLTRRIAEAHGGTVRAEGERGQGATFVLELPREGPGGDERVPRRAAEVGMEPLAGHGPT
jgi:PAS domain S-box-containing protein